LSRQAQAVKKGVKAGGGTRADHHHRHRRHRRPQGMKSSLVSREVIADSTELAARPLLRRAGRARGCDVAARAMMAMVRLNVPSIFIYGTILPGKFEGRDDRRRVRGRGQARRAQDVGRQAQGARDVGVAGGGSCGGQYTANTMAAVSEAIGLALTGSAGTPAPMTAATGSARRRASRS
jgi:dihydroxy-acid dehydratase